MAFLDIRKLSKNYGSTVALDGVDLSVNAGEFVTLLGPSGSGKTTLLMSIAGFTQPDDGGIVIDGVDVTDVDPEDRDFGVVFQGYALFPHMTVADNIAFPLKVRKWAKADISAKVEEMLSLVGLDKLAGRKPRELSGGQQQRAALARALSFGPRILLLDEPLSALDRSLREIMQRELKRLHKETGVTFIFVTHDQEEAYAMSDRIAVFHNGRIVQVGAPRDIYRKPASLFVAGFLGGNNIVTARYLPAEHKLKLFGDYLPAPPQFDPAQHGNGEVTLWVRPENLSFSEAGGGYSFPVTVLDISFTGSSERVVVGTVDGQDLMIQASSESAAGLQIGQQIRCSFNPGAIGFLASD
ncbi:ABC transporter ATP-binding protein [Rhizobium cremeum]|uniref:ABC transporter ATP-binding protein n=1 Tax=Rhizobium cremeum TaxID=2813827 RepID=UPI001FD16879|nr:ABC transporter ATP-binding protein [Rhizobium cremeum]MCJ7993754.1 ABC transporter ATP-binding protein [Rhizobium cremeum]MCJ7998811.1 ABC transporter ATP-binding protein [Rhizobium cremeum]